MDERPHRRPWRSHPWPVFGCSWRRGTQHCVGRLAAWLAPDLGHCNALGVWLESKDAERVPPTSRNKLSCSACLR